jgi:hypothetical protein
MIFERRMPKAMPDPKIVQVVDQYRAALASHDQAQLARLARLWIEIEKRLNDQILLLSYQLAERKGQAAVSAQIIWSMDRYQGLKADLQKEIDKALRDYVVNDITAEQTKMASLGLRQAQDLISASAGFAIAFHRLPVDALEIYAGLLGDGSPLNDLLREAYPDALDGIVKGLLEGLTRGLAPKETARLVADRMGIGLARITRIARTEQMRSFRMASLQQYRESGVVQGWRRMANKATACIACLALDGDMLQTEADLSDHPNGGCTAVPWVIGARMPTWELGKDWLARQPRAAQRKILGPEKYDLYQFGVPITDMVMMVHNDTWGDAPAIKNLEAIRAG